MLILTTKRNLRIIFILAFAGINIFFIPLYRILLRKSPDTLPQIIILVLLFNVLLVILYALVIRNFRLHAERGDQLQKQVQDKITELARVYEQITDAYLALDNEWRYTYINSKSAEYHELPVSELLGKVIWDVTPELVNEPFYAALHEAKAKKTPVRLELYYSKVDKWFEDLIYPTDEGVSVFYHEITEKKNAEIALRESEKQLKTSNEQFMLVAKATNDALYDWEIPENRIWGNDAFNALFNITEEESIKYFVFSSRLHPDDSGRILENFQNTIRDKMPYISEEFRFRMHDGNYRMMYNRAYIIYTPEGVALRMVGALQDITNQKLARQQLMVEKELSDSIINSLPGIFYLFNKQGRLYRWNMNFETVTGYSRDEIVKLHPLDFFDQSEKDPVLEKIHSVFKNGKDVVEAGLLTRDHRHIPYLFNGMRIIYEGEPCLMGVGIDLTEKVKAHNELRQLATHLQHVRENERTRIAREIHDELGQQLTGLKMDVSWLNRKLNHNDPLINGKISEILMLIDETVKTVRRISTQLRPSILDDLGLVAAMEWQCDEFEKRSEIKTEFTSNMSSINLHPDLATGLFRIFQESLTNVSRHAGADRIDATLHYSGGNLKLEIHDNGIGFNPEEIAGKKTLGLLGMKERTLLMGGKFEITGKPGKGSSVIIEIPVPENNLNHENSDS